jgi:hypothetical protein
MGRTGCYWWAVAVLANPQSSRALEGRRRMAQCSDGWAGKSRGRKTAAGIGVRCPSSPQFRIPIVSDEHQRDSYRQPDRHPQSSPSVIPSSAAPSNIPGQTKRNTPISRKPGLQMEPLRRVNYWRVKPKTDIGGGQQAPWLASWRIWPWAFLGVFLLWCCIRPGRLRRCWGGLIRQRDGGL